VGKKDGDESRVERNETGVGKEEERKNP